MVAFKFPKRSTTHRAAALALFRALLQQCRAAPVLEHQREQLQNIVRNRFRQSRDVTSIRWLRVSFEAGYEAIDRLDAAIHGDEASTARIRTLLTQAHEKTKQPPEWSSRFEKNRRDAVIEKQVKKSELVAKQAKTRVLDRPLPLEKLSGPRHVPVLFNANSLPVLRIKKPIPSNLSGYLSRRLELRQARHDLRQRLDLESVLARHEDEWDRQVSSLAGGASGHGSNEPMWQDAVEEAVVAISRKLTLEREKTAAMVAMMQAVVDREQELFDRENLESEATTNGDNSLVHKPLDRQGAMAK